MVSPSLLIGGGALAAGFALGWSLCDWQSEAELATVAAQHAAAVSAADRRALEAERRERDRETAWRDATKGVIEHGRAVLEEVQAAVDRVDVGNRRLRESTAAFAARACAPGATAPAAGGGSAAITGPDLLAELLGSCRETVRGMAREAELYRRAGESCERFDAVTR